jgi:hypothetical protein
VNPARKHPDPKKRKAEEKTSGKIEYKTVSVHYPASVCGMDGTLVPGKVTRDLLFRGHKGSFTLFELFFRNLKVQDSLRNVDFYKVPIFYETYRSPFTGFRRDMPYAWSASPSGETAVSDQSHGF